MRRLRVALLYGVVGYLAAAIGGYFLVLQFSGNVHDREIEATMTSALVLGPIAALVGFALGGLTAGARRGAGRPQE